MGQKSNDAVLKDVPITSSREECALSMEQYRQGNDARFKVARIYLIQKGGVCRRHGAREGAELCRSVGCLRTLLAKKECVGGMGHSSKTVVII